MMSYLCASPISSPLTAAGHISAAMRTLLVVLASQHLSLHLSKVMQNSYFHGASSRSSSTVLIMSLMETTRSMRTTLSNTLPATKGSGLYMSFPYTDRSLP